MCQNIKFSVKISNLVLKYQIYCRFSLFFPILKYQISRYLYTNFLMLQHYVYVCQIPRRVDRRRGLRGIWCRYGEFDTPTEFDTHYTEFDIRLKTYGKFDILTIYAVLRGRTDTEPS